MSEITYKTTQHLQSRTSHSKFLQLFLTTPQNTLTPHTQTHRWGGRWAERERERESEREREKYLQPTYFIYYVVFILEVF
jgi:hypothetical protein